MANDTDIPFQKNPEALLPEVIEKLTKTTQPHQRRINRNIFMGTTIKRGDTKFEFLTIGK